MVTLLVVTPLILISAGWVLLRMEPRVPPQQRIRRRQIRALRKLEPLTPTWPEPSDKRGWR